MSVGGKVLPARFCLLSIGKIWLIKSNCNKKWLLPAFLNWKWMILAKIAKIFKNKKLITKVRQHSVDTCIQKALQKIGDFCLKIFLPLLE